MIKTVYLAGPDVFYPNAIDIGERKRILCRKYGLTGLFPLDNEIAVQGWEKRDIARAVYTGNAAMMRDADAIVANLAPFRGPSADVGTAFEVGFFAALGKPVFAYSSDERSLIDRTRDLLGLPDDATTDRRGLAIEDFRLPDNLMLPGAVLESGGVWTLGGTDDLDDLTGFERCLAQIKRLNRVNTPLAGAA